jgi:glycosyltransferase involved in cell wall biosynthesis
MLNHWLVARRFALEAPLQLRPDIILCALPTVELSYEAVKYGQAAGVPVILDVRDLWPDIIADILPSGLRILGKAGLSYLFAKVKYALKHATGILAISDTYFRWALGYANRAQGQNDNVIPIGYRRREIDDDSLIGAKTLLKAKGVDATKRICWFIGSFGRTYDLGTVIAAAREMEKAGTHGDVQFVLCGTGEMSKAWTEQATGLHNVVFTGWVDAPQIAYLSGVASIALQAYAKGAPQGLANKLFEYLSAGLPILSSLKGENEEFLRAHGCGVTYEAENHIDFVNKLSALLGKEQTMKAMRKNALQLFDSQFRMELICDQTTTYLQGICDASAAQRSKE